MTWVALILGFLLLNVIIAYVPIILIVGYNLRPKKHKDNLLQRYVENDEISTEEYIAAEEERWENIKHASLKE